MAVARFPRRSDRVSAMLAMAWALVVALAAWFSPEASAAVPAGDGAGNRYHVRIDARARVAHVEADVWLPSASLALFGVQTGGDLANGQGDLLRDIVVRDAAGKSLALKSLGEGDYEVGGQGRVRIAYRVLLEHDRHRWPAGVEEVSFFTGDGLMATGNALFLAPGDGMDGPIDVRFALPTGWTAHAPWEPSKGAANAFVVASRRELLSNALFFGTPRVERIGIGGLEVTLLLGPRHRDDAPLFADLLRRQMQGYREIFGAPPRATRYQVLVNDGPDEGGAFASSFSQLVDGPATAANRLGWGFIMSHELLHAWNGLTLVPADSREEWFKEGVTDYVTVVVQARNGLLDDRRLAWRLENLARRYLIARGGQGLGMSVRAAGADKQPNRQLVYGGGALAAMTLDVELRKASDGRVGLPDLLRTLYAEFSVAGRTYALADIARHAQALTGQDHMPLLAALVEGEDTRDFRPMFADVGLRLDTYFYDETAVQADPAATPAARARYQAIFGRPLPAAEGGALR